MIFKEEATASTEGKVVNRNQSTETRFGCREEFKDKLQGCSLQLRDRYFYERAIVECSESDE